MTSGSAIKSYASGVSASLCVRRQQLTDRAVSSEPEGLWLNSCREGVFTGQSSWGTRVTRDNRVLWEVCRSFDNCLVPAGYLQVTRVPLCILLGKVDMSLSSLVFTAPALILGLTYLHHTLIKYPCPSLYSCGWSTGDPWSVTVSEVASNLQISHIKKFQPGN